MTKTLLFILIPFICFSQDEYIKNEHVQIDSYIDGNSYHINYLFKDHNGNFHDFKMDFDKSKTDLMIKKFGVSNSILKKTKKSNNDIIIQRSKIIEDAMFIAKDGLPVELNKMKLVSFYKEFTYPIANYIIRFLEKNLIDSRLNRIELAMKFVQDIPYAIPEENKQIYKLGYITPPEVLIEGFGDCDSKTILFACIMSYLINEEDIVFVSTPGHIFSAIKDYDYVINEDYIPQTQRKFYNNSDAVSVLFNNNRYIVCETAGPGRSNYGQAYKYSAKELVKNEDSFFNSIKEVFKYSPASSIYRPTSKIKNCKIETFDLNILEVFSGDCYHSSTMKYVKEEKRLAFDFHSCFMFNPPSSYKSTKPYY